jgi:hypothetical protein
MQFFAGDTAPVTAPFAPAAAPFASPVTAQFDPAVAAQFDPPFDPAVAAPVTTAVVAGRVSTGLSASVLYGKLLMIASLAPHLLHVTVNTAVSFVAPFARMGSIRIFPAASGDFLF